MRLSDAIVTALRDLGVRHVFGVSGANIEHLHDAIHRLGQGRLRSVLAKSEVGAAFMADATARVHGTLGVCCATSGGGMMNLAVGIAESLADSVPVLAIVGQVPRALEGRGGFQDSSGIGRTVDAVGLFRAIAKHVVRLDDAATFWHELEQALRAALSGRPGPSVLLVPRDAFELEVGEPTAVFPRSLTSLRSATPAPDMTRLCAALRTARRPVLLWGTGVERAGASRELRELAQLLQLPVVTTMANPGAFPHADPLFLGVVGAAGHPSAHAYLTNEADLLMVTGCGLPIMVRAPFALALERAEVFAINVDVESVARVVPQARLVQADALAAVRGLRALWELEPFVCQPAPAYELRHYVPAPLAPQAATANHAALTSSQAIEVIEPFLPQQGHLIYDAGNCAAAAIHHLVLPAGLRSTIALGMGGMGYAIAAAVGVQLESGPDERTWVMCGDGAFLMLGLEVHTSVELKLPILFVVFNDGAHGMCVTRQRLMFGGRIEAASYRPVHAATVARGLGSEESLWVGRARDSEELAAQLAEYTALQPARPGLLEVVLEQDEMPPFAPFLPQDAATRTV